MHCNFEKPPSFLVIIDASHCALNTEFPEPLQTDKHLFLVTHPLAITGVYASPSPQSKSGCSHLDEQDEKQVSWNASFKQEQVEPDAAGSRDDVMLIWLSCWMPIGDCRRGVFCCSRGIEEVEQMKARKIRKSHDCLSQTTTQNNLSWFQRSNWMFRECSERYSSGSSDEPCELHVVHVV